MKFAFGGAQRERVEIDILQYERTPNGQHDEDENWLKCAISLSVGGFQGNVRAAILTVEVISFLDQLRQLYNFSRIKAEFLTIEDQLRLQLIGDGKGHIELAGEVADWPGVGNRLHFILHFDQFQLKESINELEKVASKFPAR